jgi:hypothetical protein
MNIIVRTFLRATAKQTPQFRARPTLPQFFGILPLVNIKKFSTEGAKVIEGEDKGFTKQ